MTDRTPIVIGSGSGVTKDTRTSDLEGTVTRGRLPCPSCGTDQPAAEMTIGGVIECAGCHGTICLQVDTIQRHGELVVVNPDERSPQTELPPEIAHRLEIREKLGHGGSGVVYRAYLRGAGHDVAVKLHDLSGFDTGKSFLTEVDLTSRLKHPNIVHIYFAGNPAGKPFAVYEIVEGVHLGQYLARHAPLSVPAFFELAFQLASALAHCHAHDIIHRDIKPANLLISDDVLKIADFGVGKNLKRVESARGKDPKATSKESAAVRPPLTGIADHSTISPTDHIVGTPMYMAPEVLTGTGPSKQTDVYAAGLIFYQMLVGSHPFVPKDLDDLFQKHLGEVPADPAGLHPAIPRPLADLVMRCLAKRPEARPADGVALLEELRDAARKASVPEPLPDVNWRNLTQGGEGAPWLTTTVVRTQGDILKPAFSGVFILALSHVLKSSWAWSAWTVGAISITTGILASICFLVGIRRMAVKTNSTVLDTTSPENFISMVIVVAGTFLAFLFSLIAPHIVGTVVMGVTWLLMLCCLLAVTGAFRIQRMERELELMSSETACVTVESLPSGAKVLKHPGSAVMGVTPVRLKLTPGKLHLEIAKDGVGVRHITLKILPGRETKIRVNLAGKQLLLPGPG